MPVFVEQIYKKQRFEVSGAVRPKYVSLGVKRLTNKSDFTIKNITELKEIIFCLRRQSAAYLLVGLRVRIPPGGMDVCLL